MKKKIIIGVIVAVLIIAGVFFWQQSASKGGNFSDKNNVPKRITPTSVTLTMQEIAKHNNPTNCWIVVKGKIYSPAGYLATHADDKTTPLACGKDATKSITAEVANALVPYYIGEVNGPASEGLLSAMEYQAQADASKATAEKK